MSSSNVLALLLLCFFEQHFYARGSVFLEHQRILDLLTPKYEGEYREASFTQLVDHFDLTNTATYQQILYVNIAFIKLGGESPVKELSGGFWSSLGDEVGAWKFHLEHRFYGESQPFDDLSTEYLKWLTSDQALADAATFITAMNQQYLSNDTIWVAFGGSYPGSLAAWLRYKYPHLVHAAVSSSGPLEAKLDFGEYLQVVVDDYANAGDGCVEAISAAFAEAATAIENGDASLTTTLFLCKEFDAVAFKDPLVVQTMFAGITSTLAGAAQYNNQGFLNGVLTSTCAVLTDDELGEPLTRLGLVLEDLLIAMKDIDCLNFDYYLMIEGLKYDQLFDAGSLRQWNYQTCAELGFAQGTTLTGNVFGDVVPFELFTQICQDVFGDEFSIEFQSKAVNKTNVMNGAKNLEVTNVIYVHGSADPWYPLGIIESSPKAGPAIFINGTSHCADMHSDTDQDSEDMLEAREIIRQTVLEWIGKK